MRKAVYSGTFDPVTKGHIDIIKRASKLCDELVVVVSNNINKKTMFNLEQRLELLKLSLKGIKGVRVEVTTGLLIDFLKKNDCKLIIRGLRAVSDYEYELGMSYVNKELSKGEIETIFIPAEKRSLYISSTMVRELIKYDANLEDYLDEEIIEKIKLWREEVVNTKL